jgi:Protein of unknown function (DUF1769)
MRMRIRSKKAATARKSFPLSRLIADTFRSGAEIRTEHGLPQDPTARRKHFRSLPNRQAFGVFQAGRMYRADFFNPYIDFSSFSLRLPGGFHLNCLKYIGDKTHRLRYVFKDSEDENKVYFCVVFTLLHGEDLKLALEEEDGQHTEQKEVDVQNDVD